MDVRCFSHFGQLAIHFSLCGEFLVGQYRGRCHVAESINEQIRVVPAVEPEFHFFKVGRKMLSGETVPRSHDAALQQRECALDGVGVNVAVHVDTALVVDGLVLFSADASAIDRERV